MKRLVLFWLICTTAGFATAAVVAFMLAILLDNARRTTPRVETAHLAEPLPR